MSQGTCAAESEEKDVVPERIVKVPSFFESVLCWQDMQLKDVEIKKNLNKKSLFIVYANRASPLKSIVSFWKALR